MPAEDKEGMARFFQAPEPPPYYPVFIDLRGQRCVVVGGGQIAHRKVESLVEAGAEVVVIAPEIVPMPEGVRLEHRPFQPGDLDGAAFVIAATDDVDVNSLVAQSAKERHIWVNVVDDPVLCTVIFPAIVRCGALKIAVSTGGASPAYAKRLRKTLEKSFGPEYGELVGMLWRLRRRWEPRAIAAGMPGPQRQRAWEQVLDLPLLDYFREGNPQAAETAAQTILDTALNAYQSSIDE
ncbi:MAG: precorrin-2 dehydrogenase/sirohydrochlorin ferrochelatase family protein [Armatimonadota bacterium]